MFHLNNLETFTSSLPCFKRYKWNGMGNLSAYFAKYTKKVISFHWMLHTGPFWKKSCKFVHVFWFFSAKNTQEYLSFCLKSRQTKILWGLIYFSLSNKLRWADILKGPIICFAPLYSKMAHTELLSSVITNS